MAEKILHELPELLPVRKLTEDSQSLQIFRYQEVQQFNRLLKVIKTSLTDLIKAIQGTVVMSLALESMFSSFLLKRVPENWEKVAYPSLRPLAGWVPDLVERVATFR